MDDDFDIDYVAIGHYGVAGTIGSPQAVIPGQTGSVSRTDDGTVQSPSATTLDIPVTFIGPDGEIISSLTIRMSHDRSSQVYQVTGAQTGSTVGDAVTVTTDSGGGVSDGFVKIKIVHDNSGVEIFAFASIIDAGGGGGGK